MDFFNKHDWKADPTPADIEQGYTEEALHGLFLKCGICGGIKASELFSEFVDCDHVICGTCLDRVRDLQVQIMTERKG
jgi:hypothetical protein